MVDRLKLSNAVQSDSITLKKAVESLGGYDQTDVPWQIWLFENPDSAIALPGAITLFNHDCLHVLLDRGFSNDDEAFIIGFTMGNDIQTQWFHVVIFKVLSLIFYPKKYHFTRDQMQLFDIGCRLGRNHVLRNLNCLNFNLHADKTIREVRHVLHIHQDIVEYAKDLVVFAK
jgi:hypothetical protein